MEILKLLKRNESFGSVNYSGELEIKIYDSAVKLELFFGENYNSFEAYSENIEALEKLKKLLELNTLKVETKEDKYFISFSFQYSNIENSATLKELANKIYEIYKLYNVEPITYFYIISDVSRSGMSAKYEIYIVKDNYMKLITETNNEKEYKSYITVHGCGYDRTRSFIEKYASENNIMKYESIHIGNFTNYKYN